MIHGPEARDAATQGTFSKTPWTAVLAAARSASAGFRDAWGRLADIYWYPLYAYVRRRGYPPEETRDITQGFFAYLIDTEALDGVVEGEGRFRSFLLVCLHHYMADLHRYATAEIRRPPQGLISLDQAAAERRFQFEPQDNSTPETVFERRWARTILDQSLSRLAAHYTAKGKEQIFQSLVAHLAGDPEAVPHAQLAAKFGTTDAAIRNEMYRLRQRFRIFFRQEVAGTVPESEVESEMRHLLHVLMS